MNNQRENKIDFLRGIAAVMVVAGHAISDVEYLKAPYNIIYSIHMPLFFIISGFLIQRSSDLNKNKITNMGTIYKKIVTILVPYFMWTVTIPWIWSKFSLHVLANRLWVFSGIRGDGLWYLPVLFGLNIMFLILEKCRFFYNSEKIWKDCFAAAIVESIVLIIYIFTKHPYLLNMLSYFLPFYGGVLLKKYERVHNLMNNKKIISLSIVGYFVLFQYFDFYDISPLTQVKRIVLAVFAFVILSRAAKDMQYKNIISRFFIVCGQNSLAIYVIHSSIGDWNGILQQGIGMVFGMLITLIGSVAVCLICVGIAKLVEQSQVLTLILFGKKSIE